MACSVRFVVAAESERDQIVAYLMDVAHEPSAATRFLDDLLEHVGMLEQGPQMFPLSREPRLARLGYRVLHVMGYLVLYRVRGEEAVIAHIVHGSRDYARLL